MGQLKKLMWKTWSIIREYVEKHREFQRIAEINSITVEKCVLTKSDSFDSTSTILHETPLFDTLQHFAPFRTTIYITKQPKGHYIMTKTFTMRNVKDLIYEYAEIVEPDHVQDEFLRQYYTYKYAEETEKTRMVQGMINTITNQ